MSNVRKQGAAGVLDRRGGGMVSNLTTYLDVVRVLAAVAVLLSHVLPVFRIGNEEPVYGHDAVVFFFVLSGFVIAYVCDTRESTVGDYALSRLTRLWSVAVPALLLGLLLQAAFGENHDIWPAPPTGNWAYALSSSLVTLVFCGETWGGTWSPPYNGPFWSLNYEAWYYACYGALVFLNGRTRWIVAFALFALSGPRVMTLAPCWFAGVALYHWRDRLTLRPAAALALFAASLLAILAINHVELSIISRSWLRAMTGGASWHLGSSQAMISDYILAVVVFANFAAAASLPGLNRLLAPARRQIAGAASFTLSIYLFHMPFLTLAYLGLGLQPSSGLRGVLAVTIVQAVGIALLGAITEQKRRPLRRRLDAALAGMGRRRAKTGVSRL